jgi:hypothetical protein
MRKLIVVPWLTPVLSIVAVAILVFSIFALLKISSGGKREPGQELLTGSIQKSPAVRKPAQSSLRLVQSAVVVRPPVPLPRPRPRRI